MSDISTMVGYKIVKVNLKEPERAITKVACQILNRGGLVVAPTETSYGLLARVDSPPAVNHLYEVKGRSIDKPSAIFVANISALKELADLPPKAQIMADCFMPGPLTLVLKSKREFGQSFTMNNMTGFRISSSPLIAALVAKIGPLSATSANLSGQKEPDSIPKICEQFGDQIDLYIDGGRLNNPVSTVVQVIDDRVKVLREGAISTINIFKSVES
jgi:L-threonylcarbamoyladenylate synthase